MKLLTWVCRVVAAVILLQTLFFKFSGAEESKFIFSSLGIEPIGRIGSGIAELIASILLLIPKTTLYGALLTLGIMAGAISSHFFVLGIEIKDDGGLLFIYACITTICAAFLVIRQKNDLILLKQKFIK